MARRFGTTADARVLRNRRGHIHDTWIVTPRRPRSGDDAGIVLQRLNEHVFPDCALMVDNVVRVAEHLRAARCPTVSVLRSDEGGAVVRDRAGKVWRAFRRVPGASSIPVVDAAASAYQIGLALGQFAASVQDLPAPPLVEPIAGFKDFARRRDDFEATVDEDPFGRASTCGEEIAAVRRHGVLVDELVGAIASGQLPEHIVHNDAKADNVLLDDQTGEPVCVIDLDTVAPGRVLFDVGDLLRSATVTLSEDTTELTELSVHDDLLVGALSGYLSGAGDLVTDGERALLPIAGPLMAYESALRFLTDHLEGDTYYRVDRARQNLDRTRAQLRVLEALASAGDRVADLVRPA